MSSLKPVRGTHDLFAQDLDKHLLVVESARKIAKRFSCEEVKTPIFEFTEVFTKTSGEASDIVNKEMYTFEDRGGESLSLRPEGTAPVARAFVSNGWAQKTPLKLFYEGPMFRYERPQKGRQRQFHQFGIEYIGVGSSLGDLEVLSIGQLLLEDLKVEDFQLELNCIGDDKSRADFREKLVNYLSKFKNDLSEDSQRRLEQNPLRILDSKSEDDKKILVDAPKIEDSLNGESKKNRDEILEGLSLLEIPYVLNPLLVRGLDYYTKCVFEFTTTSLGAQNALIAGGRYDGLIGKMGGKPQAAVGFGAGIERLALLCQKQAPLARKVSLIPLGDEAELFCKKLAYDLRKSDFRVDVSFSGNMSKRMKKANSNNSVAAIILGKDELEKGEATVKNLDSGAQVSMKIKDLASELKKFTS